MKRTLLLFLLLAAWVNPPLQAGTCWYTEARDIEAWRSLEGAGTQYLGKDSPDYVVIDASGNTTKPAAQGVLSIPEVACDGIRIWAKSDTSSDQAGALTVSVNVSTRGGRTFNVDLVASSEAPENGWCLYEGKLPSGDSPPIITNLIFTFRPTGTGASGPFTGLVKIKAVELYRGSPSS